MSLKRRNKKFSSFEEKNNGKLKAKENSQHLNEENHVPLVYFSGFRRIGSSSLLERTLAHPPIVFLLSEFKRELLF